jgi:serine/threonine-protein kinase
VTPNNVLVSDKGFAKVIDFGIAKARDRVAVETRSGLVKGTPQYMSPEAACKRTVDRRSDVWSLGAILFRALRGRPAFEDHSALLDYIDGVSKLPELPEDTPAPVRAIVVRALAVSPADRFQSADGMRTALERAMHTIGATPADVRDAAAELVSAASLASTAKEGKGKPAAAANGAEFASTKLAIPSLPASNPRPQTPGGTLLSASAGAAPVSPSPASSNRALTIALIVAAIVTAAAVALAFCS